MINNILRNDIGSYNDGMTYEEIAASATTIRVGAPISPAFTADSPITSAPTILTA